MGVVDADTVLNAITTTIRKAIPGAIASYFSKPENLVALGKAIGENNKGMKKLAKSIQAIEASQLDLSAHIDSRFEETGTAVAALAKSITGDDGLLPLVKSIQGAPPVDKSKIVAEPNGTRLEKGADAQGDVLQPNLGDDDPAAVASSKKAAERGAVLVKARKLSGQGITVDGYAQAARIASEGGAGAIPDDVFVTLKKSVDAAAV